MVVKRRALIYVTNMSEQNINYIVVLRRANIYTQMYSMCYSSFNV